MPGRVLHREEAIDPGRLTGVLRAAGILPTGSVDRVESSSNDAFNSLVVHLRVTYSIDAPPEAPRALLLKRMGEGWGQHEVAFYRGTLKGERPLVGCYDAVFDPADGSSHMLLEDVSDTHAPAVARADLLSGRGVPAGLNGIMSAMAMFHARRWEDDRIGTEPFEIRPWYADDASFQEHVARRHRELSVLRQNPDAQRYVTLYEDALERLPPLWGRYLKPRIAERRALTVSHGDCYLTQWLTPRSPGGEAILVDFDSVGGNLAAFDLVFLMASFWTRPQRAEHELACLQTYHTALVSNGVLRYEWDDLLLDYRLMLAFAVFDAVFDHANGSRATYWQPKMECLTTAYRDWDCALL